MKKHLKMLPVLAVLIAVNGSPVASAEAAAPPGPFFQGFEQNTNGWFDGSDRTIVRRPSFYVPPGGYAPGVPSAAGRWHARLEVATSCTQDCDGAFTRWGGYSSTFPPGGYLTQLDIYLDTAWATSHHTLTTDYRIDWISAINSNQTAGICANSGNPPPCHLRDFVFNIGTTPTGYIVQSSTNSTRSGANPNAPCPSPSIESLPNYCRPPAHIDTSGWYTFRHTFRDNAGQLAVDFDISVHDTGAPVAHWTIFADPMSVVGGNRYGWFSNDEVPNLPIDNSLRTGICRSGSGEGDVEERDSGKRGHTHFNGNGCEGGSQGGDVEETDSSSGEHFESGSVSSATFTQEEDSQTLTMVGMGTHNSLPVAFTMVAVDNGTLGPALFSLVLSDGYVITGTVVSGTVTIQ